MIVYCIEDTDALNTINRPFTFESGKRYDVDFEIFSGEYYIKYINTFTYFTPKYLNFKLPCDYENILNKRIKELL